MKGLVISSGEIQDYNLLKEMLAENDFIICADGGVNHLLKIGKLPDIVLGDLDSIGKKELDVLEREKIEIKRFPTMKEKTDTELCVDFLLKKNFKEISLMGVTGRRLDHTLANIYLLKKIYKMGVKANIIDTNNKILYTEDTLSIKKKPDRFVSIIPISERGVEVSLRGFVYPLEKENLPFGSTMGISNKIIEDYGKVKVHRGSIIVIESKD